MGEFSVEEVDMAWVDRGLDGDRLRRVSTL
jgi:hypothetical protein